MHVAQNWRINGQRFALKAAQCEHCGKVSFPPREVCPHCQQQEKTPVLTLVSESKKQTVTLQLAAR